MPSLEISTEQLADSVVVSVAGEVDLANKQELADALLPCVGTVVVDMERVSFIDSSGLGVLAGAYKRLSAEGGSLSLRKPQRHVRRVLEISGLGEWSEGE